jgi:hypothetical protein
MTDSLSIAFVGFGEAAFHIAKGLGHACVSYDINSRNPGLGETIRKRAQETGTRLILARNIFILT